MRVRSTKRIACCSRSLTSLILFEHETGNAEAVQLLTEFHHAGRSVPFLLLTENADEKTVAELILTAVGIVYPGHNWMGPPWYAAFAARLALHSMQKEQRSAEESCASYPAQWNSPPTPWSSRTGRESSST